jgi:hypothetical protein
VQREGETVRRTYALINAIAVIAAITAASVLASTASASGTSSITGVAFEDANRNGVFDAGEAPWADQQIYLFDASGRNTAVAWTDASGRYGFAGLADGEYRVAYASPSAAPIQAEWTPTTTGTWRPTRSVQLLGRAQVDFGWRRIVRSPDLDHPMTSYRAPSGLTVQMYNDAIAPEEVAGLVAQGGLVGEEAASVTVRVDGSQYTATGSSYGSSTDGTYSGYGAIVTIDWLTWLNAGENALFHEYGHAWSGYFSVMVQGDPKLTGYLEARGLAGDPRVDGSYGWSRYELIAEDYRQLFGTPAAQVGGQANGELPPASSVAGLRDYLATTFRQPPTSTAPPPDPTATSTTTPTPLAITGLAVNPTPVTKSGVIGYSLSEPATVTVEITDARGATVRVLTTASAQAAGTQSVPWDRRDARGRRVRGGTYRVTVTAAGSATTTAASAEFAVT